MLKTEVLLVYILTPIPLILGLALSAAFILIVRAQGCEGENRKFGIGLIVAALIYLSFAVASAKPLWIFGEAVGVAIFTSLVTLGLKRSPWFLALGWAVHPIWDVVLHLVGKGGQFVPSWYPVSCISFDFLVAIYIAARIRSLASGKAAPNS